MPLDPARITPPRRGLLLLEARALLELAALVPAYPFLRRTATCDTELACKRIAQGDKLAMWYVSATRDEDVFERPNEFRIDRENARDHLAFGRGVHFYMGSRIAEMQLRVLWEETLAHFRHVEVVGTPVRVRSNFVKGYAQLPVRVHPH